MQAVTIDQLLEAIGKLVDVGHGAALHQDRNDWHSAAKGHLDFDAHRIRRIVNSASPFSRSKPTFADDHERDIGLSEHAIDVFAEVDAQRYAVDIPKHGTGPITSCKTIEYPPRDRGGIVSPVGNCYPRHLGLNLRIVRRLSHQSLASN